MGKPDWVTDVDFNVEVKDLVTNTTFVGDGQDNEGRAHRERHLVLGVGGSWGRYAHLYPEATLTAHGWLNTFEYTGTAG